MPAGAYDILIEPGSNFQLALVWKDSLGAPINLSGYSAKMQVRQYPASTTVQMEASTALNTITLGGALGTITVNVPAATTALVNIQQGVWDIELTSPSGVVTRLLQGNVFVSPEVTK